MQLSKNTLINMGWVTLLGFGAAGIVLIHFVQKRDLVNMLMLDSSVWQQLLVGVLLGVLVTEFVSLVVDIPWFNDSKKYFVNLIGPLQLKLPAIIFISFCAGIGEELFFRGAIQFWLGIWVTAVLFVLLHGYIRLKDLKLSVYGALLILASASFGYMAEYLGLLSAIIAHAVYDIIMFTKINTSFKISRTHASKS